jgi:hypothetical protein
MRPTSTPITHSAPDPAPYDAARARQTAGGGRRPRPARLLGACAAAFASLLVLGTGSAWAAVWPTLHANASPSTNVGLQVFDHTNLSGGASPTGTLTFKLYAPGDPNCAAAPVFTTTTPVSGTGSDDSAKYWTTGAGTYQWVVTYGGDANNNPVGTACGDANQQVIASPVYVAQTTTAARVGGQLHATTVISGGFAPVGGTLTFAVTGPNDQFCGGAVVYTRTVAVNGTGSYDSGSFTPTVAGTYTFRTRYSGDTDNYGFGPTPCLDANASVSIAQADLVGTAASFTNPTSGGVKDSTRPFAWTAVSGAQQYSLWVGTTVGGADLGTAYVSPSTLSYDIPMLPTGRTLYARVWTEANGAWSGYQDIAFTTSGGALLTNPAAGQSSVPPGALTWSPVSQAQNYALWIGTTPGGTDVAAASVGSNVTSYDASLPTGKTVYVRLFTMVGGTWARYQDVSFVPTGGATFTSPRDGATAVDPAQPLAWTAVGGVQYYALWVGTTPGGTDVATGAYTPGTTSAVLAGLPHGRRLYARVWTMAGGQWGRYQDISFTTS